MFYASLNTITVPHNCNVVVSQKVPRFTPGQLVTGCTAGSSFMSEVLSANQSTEGRESDQ